MALALLRIVCKLLTKFYYGFGLNHSELSIAPDWSKFPPLVYSCFCENGDNYIVNVLFFTKKLRYLNYLLLKLLTVFLLSLDTKRLHLLFSKNC